MNAPDDVKIQDADPPTQISSRTKEQQRAKNIRSCKVDRTVQLSRFSTVHSLLVFDEKSKFAKGDIQTSRLTGLTDLTSARLT
eukprot:scaffold11552_cov50-Attheya_sp.AAC.13